MSEISEFQRRINAALDRIGAGLEALGSGDATELARELEAERATTAQLEERVRAIRERQETMVARLEDEVSALRAALGDTDAELQQLRSVNAELRRSNAALREANSVGLAKPDLINASLETELAALRALQANDRGEIDRALGLLEPMLEDRSNA